jgi:hypothetical protein
MSERLSSRRQIVLLAVVLIFGVVAGWQLLGRTGPGADEETTSKAQELIERFEATGLSAEVADEDVELPGDPMERGPQAPDD